MRSWIEGAGAEAPVLGLNFERRRDFWADTYPDFANSLATGPGTNLTDLWLATSPDIIGKATAIAADLFGTNSTCDGEACEHTCLHLRRGDRLQQYPPNCANAETVARNVVQHANARDPGESFPRARENVFVMTDERDTAYLRQLRTALSADFATVRFEGDVLWPRYHMPPNDLVFRYLVLSEVCSIQSPRFARFEYHPDRLCGADGRRLDGCVMCGR